MLRTGQEGLWSAWRSAADEVWETWSTVCNAPRSARVSAYDQHLHALDMESAAAGELAARRLRHAA